MPKAVQHWLVKQEPGAYSWAQFQADGGTVWTGVRNYGARNHLRAMRRGDLVFYYHSVEGKDVVGIAKVATEAYPDPTAAGGDWSCVELVPIKSLKRPVTLAEIKTNRVLKDIKLLRQSRLSVVPLTAEEYAEILRLSAVSLTSTPSRKSSTA